MNLYRISQKINNDYDTYDSCIVIAESEEYARNNNILFDKEDSYLWCWIKESEKDKLIIEYLWKITDYRETWIILESFNAW